MAGMAPMALARKYRPQGFDGLVGQEPIARTLQNAVRRERIHNAYIFTGTRGVGKTSTARIFAKSLNCVEGPTPDPCGSCENCVEIAEGRSVDVQEIDAASHTKVEETRELLGRVAYAPAKGRYRVFIIDEAHMLSKSSFNALLKTLEEPPPHAIFILATTEPQKILETVRSRCIEFAFRRIPAARIQETLQAILETEGISGEPAATERIGFEADGSLRDALSLTDQILGYAAEEGLTLEAVEMALGLTSQETVARLLSRILERDPAGLEELYREAYRSGADLRRLGIDLIEFLREVILARTVERPGEGYLADAVERSSAWSLTDLHRMFDRLHRALVELERSPVPDILLETVLLRLAVLEPLGRLEGLLEELQGGGGGRSGQEASSPTGAGRASGGARTSAASATAPAAAGVAVSAGEAGSPRPEDAEPGPGSTATSGEAVVERLLEEIPTLRPMIADNSVWEPPELVVRLPESRSFAHDFLEARSEEILAVLRSIAGPEGRLRIEREAHPEGTAEESSGGRRRSKPAPDKRAMLEDERVKLLLDAFPGAEVVDIRFSQ